jgi:uncharacterized protein YecE (DUF72 family)
MGRSPGTLRVGTSGFSYPDWAPRFYPPGLPAARRLEAFAERLDAVELNNTFYRRPTEHQLATWAAATPPSFRFAVKAQRGATWRAFRSADPAASLRWLCEPLPGLGDRLGAVLLRVPDDLRRDDDRLDTVLEAWPAGIPLVVEARDPSWQVDETFDRLRAVGAVLCATDLDEAPAPDIRVTGPFVYLRLRRASYEAVDIETWAGRLAPFLATGLDVYAFVRHDDDGASALTAEALAEATAARSVLEAGATAGR